MLKFSKGQHHLVVSEAVIESHERAKKKGRRRIEPSKLIWKPPVFSRFVFPLPLPHGALTLILLWDCRNDLRFGF